MARGRKRIPSKIIDLRGGSKLTHRPPRAKEPKPPEKMPPCPKHLDEDAKKEWKRAGKVLRPLGLLTEMDMMIFAAYCEAYSRWVYAVKKIQEMGYVRIGEEGAPITNPYLRVAREAYDQMIKAGIQIGMSPSSRASLKVEKPKTQDSADAFLEQCKK